MSDLRRKGAGVPTRVGTRSVRPWARRLVAWPACVPLVVIALVLLGTIDDRHVGRAADERQLIWTAVALAETGQLSQARGQDFTYLQPDGRAVSRFGIGMSALEVPAALLAPMVEQRMGPGSSQPLFLLVPLLLVLLAAAFAGEATRSLGGDAGAQRAAVILTALGSPFGSYAATAFSEPLQGAALAAAYALALGSAAAPGDRSAFGRAWLAGLAASWAVLAKSSMVAVVPVVLLPALATGPLSTRVRRALLAVAGLGPGLAVWVWLEFARFGRLFGSYPGETFSHPFWDGAWRLLVGPNLGFFLFCPAAALALPAVWRSVRARAAAGILGVSASLGVFAIVVAMASRWWAWHGVWGWGPRLLVPCVPLLVAGAAVVLQGWPRWSRRALLALSIAINVPGLLQHSVPVAAYMSSLAWPRVPEQVARSFAAYARRPDADGGYRVSPDHILATVPQASQFVVFPWFFWASSGSDSRAATALATPPWLRVRPDLVPTELPMSRTFLRDITGYPRWRFWGRGFCPSLEDAQYAAVYDEGLADQVIRLQQTGAGRSALQLAWKLVRLAPFGANDALVLESYRILGDRAAAAGYLSELPGHRRAYPGLNVVLALFERDAGNEQLARQLLESTAGAFPPSAPIHTALTAGLASWPADLHSMIAEPIKPAGQ